MSSTSTSQNTSRTRKRDKTLCTMWLHFPPSSGQCVLAVSLPEHVVTLLEDGLRPQAVEILRYYGPRPDTGYENVEELLHLSSSPPSPAPVTDGSQEERRPDYYGLRDTPNIFGALYSSAYTPEADPETSLDCNGRK
jgi:hypothetical protein